MRRIFLALCLFISASPSHVRASEILTDKAELYVQMGIPTAFKELDPGTGAIRTREQLEAAWSRHFAGKLRFPDPYVDLSGLVKLNEPSCEPAVKRLVELLEDYRNAIRNSQDLAAKLHHKEILGVLASDSKCEDDLSRVLSAESLSLLAVDNRVTRCSGTLDQCEGFTLNAGINETRLLYGAGLEGVGLFSDNWTLNLLAISLLNHNRVVFLNPKLRADFGFPKEILGAYDCDIGKIYLDPSLPPYDLAASFAHEMEHLLRDKLVSSETLAGLSAQEYLFVDEAMASVFAGFLERNLHAFYGFYSNAQLLGDSLESLLTFHPSEVLFHNFYEVENDLSFFNPTGALNDMWKKIGSPGGNPSSTSYWSDFETLAFLRKDLLDRGFQLNDAATVLDEDARKVLSVVKSRYFGSAITDEQWKRLDPMNLDIGLDPLTQVLRSDVIRAISGPELSAQSPQDVADSIDVTQSSRPFYLRFLSAFTNESYSKTVILKKPIVFRIDTLLEKLDQLEETFGKSSLSCEKVDQAFEKGELSDYIGAKIGGGTRPGAEGTRPGAEGTRPGLGIRPCLSIYREL